MLSLVSTYAQVISEVSLSKMHVIHCVRTLTETLSVAAGAFLLRVLDLAAAMPLCQRQ